MKGKNQKKKIFVLNRIFEEHTDPDHGLRMNEILTFLKNQGIDAERKSVLDDIATLQELKVDVGLEDGGRKFRLYSRTFDLFEIKLLVDSIQTSKFLPQEMTEKLVNKLMQLCSRYERHTLRRQVVVATRTKNLNTRIHYSMDAIHEAIANDTQISFKYFNYDINKKRVFRKKGAAYRLSPFAMIYTDDNYYLLAFDPEVKEIRPFRVDRMDGVNVLKAKRVGSDEFAKIDMSRYTNYTFSMFGGEVESVTLRFQNRLMNAVIDRFGADVVTRKVDGYHFEITVPVAVSDQFYGWVFGLGKKVRIGAPESVKEGMKKALADITQRYE